MPNSVGLLTSLILISHRIERYKLASTLLETQPPLPPKKLSLHPCFMCWSWVYVSKISFLGCFDVMGTGVVWWCLLTISIQGMLRFTLVCGNLQNSEEEFYTILHNSTQLYKVSQPWTKTFLHSYWLSCSDKVSVQLIPLSCGSCNNYTF